ncbi:hypothetical protein QE382_003179 [Sphingobacterium zeae]|uniref:Protein NO VEIN C-terminal domain-containing protein n=1 Tax=Sphingobacterium zeae TaxID=1776859 RepID=A0ABU0U8C8_9SPHI|nr:DUF3883 domain-containing protein [Sphingobacterium zeae]MDQ1151195.1 hypothetical protein [Sphingobacterium zeae]
MRNKFIDTEKELSLSISEFFNKPQFWKDAIGNSPKYFVHMYNGDRDFFALSKFCAFRNVTVEDYITKFRYETNGTDAQRHISRLMKRQWMPMIEVSDRVREAFTKWIRGFYPSYNLNNASIISIENIMEISSSKCKFISPATLEDMLRIQREIGKVGEQIAFEYELNRLRENGIKNPQAYIEHTSKINSAAGFDLTCSLKDDYRFIEVKSSFGNSLDFYITENEIKILEELGENAYIYFVRISDLEKSKGIVIRIQKNPILTLRKNGILKPILFRAEFS